MTVKQKPKRTRMRREDRIESILVAAREVFENKAYQDATVAEIADKLGVTDANVYAFFPSKRDLLVALISRWYEGITEEMLEGLRGISGLRNKLRFVIWRHLKTLHDEPKFCAMAIAESRHYDQTVAQVLHNCNRRYTRPLIEILKEGVDSGELRKDTSPPLVRNMVFGTLEHILWDIVSERPWLDTDAVADQLSEQLYRSVCETGLKSEFGLESRLSKILDKIEAKQNDGKA